MSEFNVFFEDIDTFYINTQKINKLVEYLVNNENYSLGDFSIIFCSDKYLLEINKKYLNHDYYTDIITFNYNEGKLISGDLFISIDRILENAHNFAVSNAHELLRVIFHGTLHLVGYNDKTEEEIKIMREKENYYLKNVDLKGIEL